MGKKKTAIHEHQRAIDELDFSIERQTEELGRLLLEKKLANIDEVKDSYSRGTEIQKKIGELEKQKNNIRRDEEKQSALREQMDGIDSEEKLYRDGHQKLLASLGSHAHRVYRSGALEEEDFTKVFSEIDRIEAEIIAKRRLIQDHTEQKVEKNLFRRLPYGARIALLKTTIGRMDKQRAEKFPLIGRKLLDENLVEKIPDEQVQGITANLKQQEEQSGERTQQKEKMQSEYESIRQNIEKLCGQSAPDKKVKELDEEIADQQKKLFQQSREIGQAFLLQPSLEKNLPKVALAAIERIDGLKAQKQDHENQVHVLQAEMEIDDLQENVRKKEAYIAKLEQRINEEKQQIVSMRDDLIQDNNRVQELRKIVHVEPETEKPSP
jgi:chromosome segregation ATPase